MLFNILILIVVVTVVVCATVAAKDALDVRKVLREKTKQAKEDRLKPKEED